MALLSSDIANADAVLTDDEDDIDEVCTPILAGTLNKWTNYIHGWQSRYFVLKEGTLSYYKSEHDTTFGCRGAISIGKAAVQIHDFDECRFDVSVNDCVWYLRTDTVEERQNWVEALELLKTESGYGSQGDLRRHGSMISLTSNKSLTSVSSTKRGTGLKEKLAEIETFRDILCRQIDTLQFYFDHCSQMQQQTHSGLEGESDEIEEVVDDLNAAADAVRRPTAMGNSLLPQPSTVTSRGVTAHSCIRKSNSRTPSGNCAIDFKGEALTFKATTAGVLATLQHCTEIMQQREESWKKRLEKEIEKRKKLQEGYAQSVSEVRKKPAVLFGGPDFEEGPHSALNEEEWHDAMDAALERQDKEDERLQRLLSRDSISPVSSKPYKTCSISRRHSLYSEIETIALEQLHYAQAGVNEGVWQLFAEDGEMKMFKRELEIDGMVCDPLKAVHVVKGVTGHEYCHYFFESEYKLDWDTTLERVDVLERIADDTIVLQQLHKRVWPASQRESLFWSHMRRVPNHSDRDAHDIWVVCNHDTEHEKAVQYAKCIRVGLTIAMVCQTLITPPPEGHDVIRDNLTCKIAYVAQVNPGGWAPSSVLRAVYKREYPKFLKRFTQYVLSKTEGQPIMF